ncbi:phosphatidylglycerophosphatase A [Psychrobium sp. 1_MG-2023]|uniref:phosphatidylglycerophosphatase A family protein n=1 Tax=Psychrobium sp. 1_MG-2023 TaxID=3062624 RepID=UPI000C3358FA|nr:phosphatidylglycerophosphatase A [Psychrobium sp. 1_MG-2023]MDP2561823.1 phosphatidylglycerophosphatase A [Psychrobium sp. 1_MG-2023]PKF55804.1 phosphatidylglycerophosphatase A [Alteromonadales bacterium alter-6D02]
MKHQDPALAKLSLANPWHFLALGFGSGLAPKAPGTFGTLAALPLYFLMMDLSLFSFVIITIIITVAGFWICDKTAKDMQIHDHGAIVWDEVAGMLITLIAAPVSLTAVIVGFVLFRFFDILKPWPIKLLDRHVHGGFGIMIDDVLAGVFAALCLQGIHYYIWPLG